MDLVPELDCLKDLKKLHATSKNTEYISAGTSFNVSDSEFVFKTMLAK